MSNKIVKDFSVIDNIILAENYSHLVLREIDMDSVGGCVHGVLDYSDIFPGQFVEIRIYGSSDVFLRRPISINDVVPERREIHLLVRNAGAGTDALCRLKKEDVINMVLPLGNGFSIKSGIKRPLLIGGGVGAAPLLYLGKCLRDSGITPHSCWLRKRLMICLKLNVSSALGRFYYRPMMARQDILDW